MSDDEKTSSWFKVGAGLAAGIIALLGTNTATYMTKDTVVQETVTIDEVKVLVRETIDMKTPEEVEAMKKEWEHEQRQDMDIKDLRASDSMQDTRQQHIIELIEELD